MQKEKVVNHFPLFTKVLKFSCEELPALLRLQTHHIVHGQPHSSGYRYSRTDTVEAMTALGRQPKVGKCVCVYVWVEVAVVVVGGYNQLRQK